MISWFITKSLSHPKSTFYLLHRLSHCLSPATKFKNIDVINLYDRLCSGDRSALAQAITLVESQHPEKRHCAQNLLNLVMKNSREDCDDFDKAKSFRIGLTGAPGAGKSTFIESFGKFLTNKGHKVAVLAVDPSSSTTGGSLLGDKTRMPELSRDMNAFIRPSPSSGCLGGVTRSTHESIALCERAGYDIVLVETVGVGQSEFHVSYMVDMFVMLVSPTGGDELQGLKKGIVELVDLIIVNKADGELIPSARRIQSEYISALKFVRRRFKSWRPSVLCVSSKTKEGIEGLWEEMMNFNDTLSESNEFYFNRKKQYNLWMWLHIENTLMNIFKKHPKITSLIPEMESQVQERIITPGQASDILLKKFLDTL